MGDTTETALATAYGHLLGLITETPDLDMFLTEVVTLAADMATPPAAVGLTMHRDCRPFTVASSSVFAAQLDGIQYGAEQGPCLETLDTGEPVQVDDLPAEDRWDRYRPHAVAHGVLSSLSLPLSVDGQTVGVLNMYGTRRSVFAGPVRVHAEAFARQCAGALKVFLRQADLTEVQRQLDSALASRSIIDQAMGILMAQQRCPAAAAFEVLRAASQHRNRKLRDVAAELITTVTGEPPQTPAGFRTGTGRA